MAQYSQLPPPKKRKPLFFPLAPKWTKHRALDPRRLVLDPLYPPPLAIPPMLGSRKAPWKGDSY